MSRSLYAYQSKDCDATPLVMRIEEITATRVHYGYRRVQVLLKREGWPDNGVEFTAAKVMRWLRYPIIVLGHAAKRAPKECGCQRIRLDAK
ncbi:hypothetical protein Hsc_3803 [Herbaspirillum seropedicae]|nr:hypothetical protein Hsc_3803 [Herbaspirillum seropedicae]